MDVERTIQSILKTQTRSEARIDAITKLLHRGMRMLVKVDTKLSELAKSQKELAEAQKASDRSLRALIDSLRNAPNGH
jgi:hypothetical protein